MTDPTVTVRVSFPDGHAIDVPAHQVRTEHRALLPDGRVMVPGALAQLFGTDDLATFAEHVHKMHPDALLESRRVFTFPTEWSPA